MAWVTPWTATTGSVLTAAQMNEIRDNLRYLKGLDGAFFVEAGVTWREDSATGPVLYVQNTGSSNVYCGNTSYLASTGGLRGQVRGLQAFPGGLELFGGGNGRMQVCGASGITATAVTIIPSGVTRRWHAWGVAYANTVAGSTTINAGNIPGAATSLYTDGTNTLTCNTSSGALTVYRTAGSYTFDITMIVAYH